MGITQVDPMESCFPVRHRPKSARGETRPHYRLYSRAGTACSARKLQQAHPEPHRNACMSGGCGTFGRRRHWAYPEGAGWRPAFTPHCLLLDPRLRTSRPDPLSSEHCRRCAHMRTDSEKSGCASRSGTWRACNTDSGEIQSVQRA
jgi:hypothetical protein